MSALRSGSITALPREWQFLLAGAKLEPAREDCVLIRNALTHPGVDWERLVDSAYQHDIAPLVYRSVHHAAGTDLPLPAALNRLRAAYLGNALRNTLLFGELNHFLRKLLDHRKPVVVLKGAALAESIYGDRALRPMSDVDLLIQKNDIVEIE